MTNLGRIERTELAQKVEHVGKGDGIKGDDINAVKAVPLGQTSVFHLPDCNQNPWAGFVLKHDYVIKILLHP
ncbi:MAG: hypothetical protein AAFZ92_05740 [Pseudomonadota bacterium]